LDQVSPRLIAEDPQLLYWSGASIVLKRPADAHPRLSRAFELFQEKPDGTWTLLAWAGLVDSICLWCRDLRELDPLLDWMTPERERIVDQMPRSPRSLVVGSALFAFSFRQPAHPRMSAWRERAERLVEIDPTSDLGGRLAGGLIVDYTWRGNLGAAEIVWKRFAARASRVRLSPLATVTGHLNEATLSLHQGKLEACLSAVETGLRASSHHAIQVWDGVMHCHAVAAFASSEDLAQARQHLGAIETLFADGLPIDEAYYRAMLFWTEFLAGNHVGAVSRALSAIEVTDAKGAPYLSAVCRMGAALTLFEAGHRDRGRALLAEGLWTAEGIGNPLVAWIGGLFRAHMAYESGETSDGDAALASAMRIGRDHSLVHFFFWPRRIIASLIDRALLRGYSSDYAERLIATHGFAPGPLPTRSHCWSFMIRIYTFGDPRIVDAGGREQPLSAQSPRQIALLSSLIGRQGAPTSIHTIAADVYAEEPVDPLGSLKRVLHSLRSRVGPIVIQHHSALALDFGKVWIDACSFQQLRREGAGAIEIEAWLDQYYRGDFLDRAENAAMAQHVRQRFRHQVERVIRDAYAAVGRAHDAEATRRLDARWRGQFPNIFASPET
jgi:hypothetical protein